MENRWKLVVFLVLLLVAIPLVIFVLSRFQSKEPTNPEVLSAVIEETNKILGNPIEDIAKKTLIGEGKYAVVVKHLKSDEAYVYNSDLQFNSASLYKLWLMAIAHQKLKDGTLKEDEVLSMPIQTLNDTLSTTTPTPTPPDFTPAPTPSSGPQRVSMRADDAINRMITISDNYAALLIASRSGTFSVTTFLKANGFENSNFRQPPQTTAEDIASFYEKLYNGEIVDKGYSEKMIDILKDQTLNDRIPKYLPKNTPVAHKTGELFKAKHDAGIVYSPKGDYIIVVLSETSDVPKAAERIAKFSEEVYKYFTSIR